MTSPSISITFDRVPDDRRTEMIEEIMSQMEYGRREGVIRTDDPSDVRWTVSDHLPPVDIDRRQRLAAAALLMAFDLPQTMAAVTGSGMEASGICPELTTGEIPHLKADGRRHILEKARTMIDEMLEEMR